MHSIGNIDFHTMSIESAVVAMSISSGTSTNLMLRWRLCSAAAKIPRAPSSSWPPRDPLCGWWWSSTSWAPGGSRLLVRLPVAWWWFPPVWFTPATSSSVSKNVGCCIVEFGSETTTPVRSDSPQTVFQFVISFFITIIILIFFFVNSHVLLFVSFFLDFFLAFSYSAPAESTLIVCTQAHTGFSSDTNLLLHCFPFWRFWQFLWRFFLLSVFSFGISSD